MKKINFLQLPQTLWKNGRGITRQVIIYPENASLENFLFRVSLATISEIGPFSYYPGIDRSLAVLEGENLTLALENHNICFTPKETIINFDGMDKAEVIICPNPVLDFGVMSQGNKVTHILKKVEWFDDESYIRSAPYTLIFSLSNARLSLVLADDEVLLNSYDSLFLTPTDPNSLTLGLTHVLPNGKAATLFIVESILH